MTERSPVNQIPRRRSGFKSSTTAVVVSLALVAGAWATGWLMAVERVSGDLLMRVTNGKRSQDPPVIAVVIDDRSINEFGALPWPRDRLAILVDRLHGAGCRGVVVDLILAEPGMPEEDGRLAEALAERPAILAAALDSSGSWLLPLEVFGGASVAAHPYGEIGPDGVVRTFATTKQSEQLALPALSLAAARLIERDLAITPGIVLRPEFRPAPQDLPQMSAGAILAGRFQDSSIRGRLAFVGIGASGAGDQFVVPTGPRHTPIPGVLVHASATSSILAHRLLRVPDPLWTVAAACLLAFGVQRLRDRRGAFDPTGFILLVLGTIGVAVVALRAGLVLTPIATLVLTMTASGLTREAVESRFAHHEIGRLLQGLLAHLGQPTDTAPTGARSRLRALEQVQERILVEDGTKQALLDGMAEGMVLWDRDGRVLLSNPAFRRLWGTSLSTDAFDSQGGTAIVARNRRELALTVTDLAEGRIGIIRDVTAERALDRRREEMQRLVSHELKTPLASIAGLGENIQLYELSAAELDYTAGLIRGEADRLQKLVSLLLDLERLGSGHWDDEISPIDLGGLVIRRVEILEGSASARGIRLSTELGDDTHVDGVATLLERMIDNLVGNAVKYTGDGDVVEIAVHRFEEHVVFSVSDNGPGIPEAHRDRLFERFYRVPGAGSSGAGLGLALVREVVDWHGGCIDLESEPGVGSSFVVKLPAARED
ncbi:MAG: CHASE2 and HATPase_c domain-containing protein [Holophagae bacterium]|jgi:signal transduction histidine kinase